MPYTEEMRASFKQSTEKAVGTLVLDADIQQLPQDFTYREAFLRINYCSWSSRMWTLQEAVLTPRVFFQLRDGYVELEDVVKRSATGEDCSNVPVKPLLAYIHLRQYHCGTNDAASAAGSADHLAMLRQALKDRRTSNQADKRLIVANLLGMEVASVPKSTFRQVLGQEATSET
ncbi:hypothetical protein LTR84_003071 [Exophiala bonariae]|uniref:HNH nuclease domain-containing protein n=1 Tax=Exophiala bonariae TaxID=1690606 RepID=A0AAV9NAH8_9EURO|nr:hypothetical protein LTR84_003071 [Exophiala bonariae]